MKYFINAPTAPTEDTPTHFVIVSEDGREYNADKKTIDADAIAAFMDTKQHGKAEVWAYNAKDWWPDFHSTFSLPKDYKDLKEWHEALGAPTLPAPPVNASPREQAVWNRDVWAFLARYDKQVTGTPAEEAEEEPPEEGTQRKKASRKK